MTWYPGIGLHDTRGEIDSGKTSFQSPNIATKARPVSGINVATNLALLCSIAFALCHVPERDARTLLRHVILIRLSFPTRLP